MAFLSALWLRGTLPGTVLNWLRIVVDSAKGGSKNGSALLGLRGTMPGKIINWLGVVADLCYLEAGLVSCWATEAMSYAVGWRRIHGRLLWGCR